MLHRVRVRKTGIWHSINSPLSRFTKISTGDLPIFNNDKLQEIGVKYYEWPHTATAAMCAILLKALYLLQVQFHLVLARQCL